MTNPADEIDTSAPTSPQPRDANGYALDADGLPINGPARARALAARETARPSAPPASAKKAEKIEQKDDQNG